MVSVIDVASYILQKRGSMTTMKLQKLCYYSQAWNLAWDEKPLFHEPIQAWANGPVVYALFERHRGKFVVEQDDIAGNPEALDRDERETIDAVLDAYGHLTGQQLSDITHSERPWKVARGEVSEGEYCSEVIDLDIMQDYYGGLDSAAAS